MQSKPAWKKVSNELMIASTRVQQVTEKMIKDPSLSTQNALSLIHIFADHAKQIILEHEGGNIAASELQECLVNCIDLFAESQPLAQASVPMASMALGICEVDGKPFPIVDENSCTRMSDNVDIENRDLIRILSSNQRKGL